MRRIDKGILIPADCSALELLVDALSVYDKLKRDIAQRDLEGHTKRRKRLEVEILKMYREFWGSGFVYLLI